MRLTKITTKNGDDGTTAIANGDRLLKSSARIQAIGDVDELNSMIGFLHCATNSLHPAFEDLNWIQNRLFDLGGELASGSIILRDEELERIESWVEKINDELPPLHNFILPSAHGKEDVCRAHLCRSIARRAERSIIALREEVDNTEMMINENSIIFLNRLSDYFFVLARDFAEGNETLWQPIEKPEEIS